MNASAQSRPSPTGRRDRVPPRHLIRLEDFSRSELDDLCDLSLRLKREGGEKVLEGRSIGLLFFRGSLRTRTSFEVATHQLGGHTVELSAASDFWELETQDGSIMDGRAPEHVKDAAAVLSRYVDALAIRSSPAGRSWDVDRRDADINAWAQAAKVPVINMESALWHPLQALADLFTMREALGKLEGRTLAITWTHSPVAASPSVVHSLLLAAARFGVRVRLAHPPGYELDAKVRARADELAREAGTEIVETTSREQAVEGAEIVYARSWQSLEDYGNATLSASRLSRTTGWTVDETLMARGDDARLMHAMPVRRNLEVTDEVLDGPRSLMVEQAENRLHSQKALLTRLLVG